ncbi:MAG: MerR family transcriptional regulator [Polyangiaceae bacterium]
MTTVPAPDAPEERTSEDAAGESGSKEKTQGASTAQAGAAKRKTTPPPQGGMRMAELALRSGVARETIHFYLREGLLPRPRKAGRTVAYYDEEHLSRLKLIRTLREEKYLPLAVIRKLLDSPAAAERDVDTLASVLHLVSRDDAARKPTGEAIDEALRRGLLGPRDASSPAIGSDPAEQRLLAIVEEALGLDAATRDFTLRNLELVAQDQTSFVMREAELFFGTVLETADIGATITALRGGRGLVARFIGAYRDLMLRRIVEDLLLAIQHGNFAVARAATVPLSAKAERELGTFERRADLRATLSDQPTSQEATDAFVWHLFACGAVSELSALPPEVAAAASLRAQVLIAWGSYESARSAQGLRALERAVDAAPDFALGQILLGEASVVRGLRRHDASSGLLERSVPAMHRLVRADPESDPEPIAKALGCFYRGRVEIAMPAVIGRQRRGVAYLERALALVGEEADPLAALTDTGRLLRGAAGAMSTGRASQPPPPPPPETPAAIEPACRARVAANARLSLGRYFAATGDVRRARAVLELAASVDPDGPIGDAVREELLVRSALHG